MPAFFKGAHAMAASLAAATSCVMAAAPDFRAEVRPILAEHCFECHGPDKSKGGLNLTAFSTATKELKSGAVAIVPGKPEASELIRRIQAPEPEDRMPPGDKGPLQSKEIDILGRWIAAGGQYAGHWAYQPVASPLVPAVRQAAWPRTAVDHFILDKLEKAGLQPSPEAGRYTLLRRVYYDLLGLPPDPDEADRFASDTAPDAFERMVDRLLADPHFGERWGRHWLDAARYADSDGYEKDRPRSDAWRYRDWVIRAFNQNMPFDQFTIEQIAGDLLPQATPEQIVATAFHRQTLTNDEGGVDKEQYRMEAVFDRVETVGNVWLGLTVGCARCHSHKYDQLTHREYYQLLAFFNNTDEVTAKAPATPEAWRQYERQNGPEAEQLISLQRRLDQARARFATRLPDWEKDVQLRLASAKDKTATFQFLPVQDVTASSKTSFEPLEDGSWLAVEPSGADEVLTFRTLEWNHPMTALRIEFLDDPFLPCNGPGRGNNGVLALSRVKARLVETAGSDRTVRFHSPTADREEESFPARAVLDDDDRTAWAVTRDLGQPHSLTLQLARPLPPGRSLWITLESKAAKVRGGPGRFRLLASYDETEQSILPDDIRHTLAEEPARRPLLEIEALVNWAAQSDEEVEAISADLDRLQQRFRQAPLMDVRVVSDRVYAPRTTRILNRGDFLNPSDEVSPDAPAVLPRLRPRAAHVDRLDLARWLVNGQNPLPPRVAVNQVWLHLFGEGLVRTPNDFGVRGEPPTHPELLDWLAHEFVASQWNYKDLIRQIVTSATYRQSAQHHPELAEVDPQNRLWHRQNRLRVEAEIIRDLHLAASGLLASRIGGPSVFPPMPGDVAAVSYANNFQWKPSPGADRYRRGLYTFFKRTAPYPDLMTFDCPDANLAVLRRRASNTPLQALTTLNAEAFAEAAKALAARVLAESTLDTEGRLVRAFRLCISRPPSSREIAVLHRLLADALSYYTDHVEQASELAGSYAPDRARALELAAWTATTRIILNLDEVITRD